MNVTLLDTLALATTLRPGASLPVARYRFTFRMQHDLSLPEFAGSLLRGQFGASLRRIACMTGASAGDRHIVVIDRATGEVLPIAFTARERLCGATWHP